MQTRPTSASAGRLFIGDIAGRTGLSRDTLRFYERLGLLRPGGRTAGGYRWYLPDAVHRVRVIQRALVIGFSLADLASLFRERATGRAPCKRFRALADEKLVALFARIADLRRLKRQLQKTIATWDARLAQAGPDAPAYLLDGLAELSLSADGRPRDEAEAHSRRPIASLGVVQLQGLWSAV